MDEVNETLLCVQMPNLGYERVTDYVVALGDVERQGEIRKRSGLDTQETEHGGIRS